MPSNGRPLDDEEEEESRLKTREKISTRNRQESKYEDEKKQWQKKKIYPLLYNTIYELRSIAG
jgi:hypothetical protein